MQLPLIVPEDLSIEEIEFTPADSTAPIRWARATKDRVNVFLGQSIDRPSRLVLRGSLNVRRGSSAQLPVVSLSGASNVMIVQLYRNEDALLTVDGLPEQDETLDAPLDSPPAAWKAARHVAGYRLSKSAAGQVRLKIAPNNVELHGDSVMSLTRTTEGWIGSFQCDFSVARGELDTLLLRVPPTWTGTPVLDSSSPASIGVAAVNAQGKTKTLAVRFAESVPAGTAVNLRIDAPLTFAPAAVSAPSIQTEPRIAGGRYVRVPSAVDGQPVVWKEVGLRRKKRPEKLQPRNTEPDALTFEIDAEPYQLSLQPRPSSLSARVRLADSIILRDSQGGQVTTARFVIESKGIPDCTLRLPSDEQLAALRLAGRPALAEQLDADNWRVSIGPSPLPSVLEVVTRSIGSSQGHRRKTFKRPALLVQGQAIPVEINLWSFGHPAGLSRPSIEAITESTAEELAVLRFDRLLSIAESGTSTAFELPGLDGYNWYRVWAALLTQLRTQAIDTSAEPQSRQRASQVSHPWVDQLTQASERLDNWIQRCMQTFDPPDGGQGTNSAGGFEMWSNEASSSHRWVYCVTDGALDALTVEYAAGATNLWQARAVGLLAVVSLAIAAMLVLRKSATWDFVYQWPHAIGFLIGIAYWAWLQPSWLGLVIAISSVLLACRGGWPGRAIHLDASTVLRASRPK